MGSKRLHQHSNSLCKEHVLDYIKHCTKIKQQSRGCPWWRKSFKTQSLCCCVSFCTVFLWGCFFNFVILCVVFDWKNCLCFEWQLCSCSFTASLSVSKSVSVSVVSLTVYLSLPNFKCQPNPDQYLLVAWIEWLCVFLLSSVALLINWEQLALSIACNWLSVICITQLDNYHGVPLTQVLLSLIHIWRCRRAVTCRSRWSPYH